MEKDAVGPRIVAKTLMTKTPLTLDPEMSVVDAIQLLVHEKISSAVVIGASSTVLGLLSAKECMLAVRGAIYFTEAPKFTVADVMSTIVETIEPETPLINMAERFSQRPHSVLPVCERGRFLGEVRRHDVLAAYLDHFSQPRALP